ncbi:MAG: FMN-binding protein [Oscillospiraceae bacterium]|nr:FMN-binding protein [Oscillospiraceae bacterium]
MKKIIALALSVVMAVSMVACGGAKTETHELKMSRVLGAAHGTKCFTTVTAVVEGDKVVAAYIDEYQFMSGDELKSVPNAENYVASLAEGVKLVSKRADTAVYSAKMAAAGSTVAIDANYDAIQAHVAGKTIAELETLVAGEATAVVDAVAGATLVDAAGYIGAVIDAAKAAQTATAVTYEGSLDALVLKTTLGAAHGTKCFAETSVLTDGEKVVLAYIDEYQFMSGDALVGVPNSENFTASLAEGVKLVSKRMDTAVYSEKMAAAGSTVAIDANYDAVQAHVAGKTIAELETLVAGEATAVVDAVAGATLVDTAGYIGVIIETAKA